MIHIPLKPDVFAVTLAPGHILYWPLKYPHQCSSVQLIGDKIHSLPSWHKMYSKVNLKLKSNPKDIYASKTF